jgi:tetratricopeptide (TPR) repeat protein
MNREVKQKKGAAQTGDSALYEKEVETFSNLLEEDPGYAYERCGLGLLYSLPPESIIDELKKFGWKASSAQDLFNLGAIHSQKGDHKNALKYYEKAIEVSPDHADSYYNLALTYKELGQEAKAKEMAEKCAGVLGNRPSLFEWQKQDLERVKQFLEQTE